MNAELISKENINKLFSLAKLQIKNQISVNLDNKRKYESIFEQLVKKIYDKKKSLKSLDTFNRYVIQTTVPFLIDTIQKKQTNSLNKSTFNVEPFQVPLSTRPLQADGIERNATTLSPGSITLSPNATTLSPGSTTLSSGTSTSTPIDMLSTSAPLEEQTNDSDVHESMRFIPDPTFSLQAKDNNVPSESGNFVKVMNELNKKRQEELKSKTNPLEQLSNELLLRGQTLDYENKINTEEDDAFFEKLTYTTAETTDAEAEKNLEELNEFQKEAIEKKTKQNEMFYSLGIQDHSNDNIAPKYKNQPKPPEFKNNSIVETFDNEETFKQMPYNQMVILDTQVIAADVTLDSFSIQLSSSLIINRPYDVFLEFISLHNLNGNTTNIEQYHSFVVNVSHIDIHTRSNNPHLHEKLVIPNDSYGTSDNSADSGDGNPGVDASSITLKLKSNYVGTVGNTYFNNPNQKATTINDFLLTIQGVKQNVDSPETLKSVGSHGRAQVALFFKYR
jgi:hypothetical protein